MTNGQKKIWERRWQALDETIKDFYYRLVALRLFDKIKFLIFHAVKQPQAKQPEEILSHLAERLQYFAKKQFDFFHNGFSTKGIEIEGTTYKLEHNEELPCEHVLWSIMQQIHYDAEVLSRAMAQRRGSGDMKKALDKGDRLVRCALETVIGEGEQRPLDEGTDAITYFQKYPSIRVIPYAPVALISVPLTVIKAPRDYLVTPHEVGHYVYWRGKKNGEPIYRALADLLDNNFGDLSGKPRSGYEQIRRWREEIFADVCGCLIGGPVVALSSQDVALEYHSASDFTADDGEHPVPALRPCIYIYVLEQMHRWDNAADILKRRWAEKLNERISGPVARFESENVCEKICNELKTNYDLEIDCKLLEEVIQKILESELLLSPEDGDWGTGWAKDLKDKTVSWQDGKFDQEWYKKFREYSENLVVSQCGTPEKLKASSTEWKEFDWKEDWLDDFVDPATLSETGQGPNVPPHKWVQMLEPWTTEIGNHSSGG